MRAQSSHVALLIAVLLGGGVGCQPGTPREEAGTPDTIARTRFDSLTRAVRDPWLMSRRPADLMATVQTGTEGAIRAVGMPVLDELPDGSVGRRYIVTFSQDGPGLLSGSQIRQRATQLVQARGGRLVHTYQAVLQGFSAVLKPEDIIELEQTGRYSIEPVRWTRILADQNDPPSWGLDRIDQREVPLNKRFTYQRTGRGVNVYVVDSGVRTTHRDFAGVGGSGGFRARQATHFVDGSGADLNGHGTHVAGTIGGRTFGVAKDVTVHSVKVAYADGSAAWDDIIAGIEWVRINHRKPAVMNLSVGGGEESLKADTAVMKTVAAGITVVIAAGNRSRSACDESMARVPSAITVAATDEYDQLAWFSNYGDCVDLFAPGDNIRSAWNNTDEEDNAIWGTSMAAPHVTGAVALYLERYPNATPAQVAEWLTSNATKGVVEGIQDGTANRLLFLSDP
jgi:aqualysin 1